MGPDVPSNNMIEYDGVDVPRWNLEIEPFVAQ